MFVKNYLLAKKSGGNRLHRSRRLNLCCLGLILLSFCGAFKARAQQPFVTDDADTTEKGKFHFEASSELDYLQISSLPTKNQNFARAEIDYGLWKNLEIGVQTPFLIFINQADNGSHLVGGFGDVSFGVKYKIREERENSHLPAFAVTGFLQIPTGSSARRLGSGIVDYGFNTIAQKSFGKKNTARVNAGLVIAGNTQNGVEGIFATHGAIFTGGASFVRKINEKLQLGAELAGAVTNNFRLSAGQLQFQTGGNYQINKKTSFDFGFIIGHFAASPRFGAKIGVSYDF